MKNHPASKPQNWPLAKILPYPNNARSHPPEQITLLATLMKKHGIDQPIVVDEDGVILKGHGRRLAAIEAGFTEFPVVMHRGLSDDDKRALRISDNQVALLGGWDEGLLRLELTDLSLSGYEMKLLGFEDAQLVSFMAGAPSGNDPEATPEPPVNPVSRTGDLWLLGKHRILCGDSTKTKDVESVVAGAKIAASITDPPYNVGIDYDGHDDSMSVKKYEEFTLKWFDLTRKASPVVLLTPGTSRGKGMPNLKLWYKLAPPDWVLIWIKKNAVVHSSIGGFNNWEPIYFYGSTKRKIGQDIYDIPITVQADVADKNGTKLHPTPKQVSLWSAMIDDFTVTGDRIYEPFSGSGTSIIAAEKTNRYCSAIEISGRYVDVAVQRWQAFANGTATLVGDGRTFAQIAKERLKGPAKADRRSVAHSNGKKAPEPPPPVKRPRGRPRKVVEPELLQ